MATVSGANVYLILDKSVFNSNAIYYMAQKTIFRICWYENCCSSQKTLLRSFNLSTTAFNKTPHHFKITYRAF